jgi:hypothetical protein
MVVLLQILEVNLSMAQALHKDHELEVQEDQSKETSHQVDTQMIVVNFNFWQTMQQE